MRLATFWQASLRGWQYAMAHPQDFSLDGFL
jgi:hypothetical protein